MKTIGLLGGMSWESTASYYKLINEEVKKQLGGLHSAKIVMYSVNFDEIEKLQHIGDWDKTAEILAQASKNIQNASADFIVLCTNTMHKVLPQIEDKIDIPFLHIADATGKVLLEQKIKKVGLLGTAFTMTQNFYKKRIEEKFDIEVIIPKEEDINLVHKVIYEELCLGIINKASKEKYLEIIDNLSKEGAQGVILGCTEIGMLIKQKDTNVKLFDTTSIHAKQSVIQALA